MSSTTTADRRFRCSLSWPEAFPKSPRRVLIPIMGDPDRYFIVLAARQNEFYDHSGSAFPMLIKLAGGVPEIAAAGTYSDHGVAAFGPIPPQSYKNSVRRSRG